MTLLTSLKRTSYQTDLLEHESKSVKIESGHQVPKLSELLLLKHISNLNEKSLEKRLSAACEKSLVFDLKMKIAQDITAEALEKAEDLDTIISIFKTIKELCTINDEEGKTRNFSPDYFQTYFDSLIEEKSENKHHIIAFDDLYNMTRPPSQDPAILKMIGLWYECQVPTSKDLRKICKKPNYITKIQLNYPFGEEDCLMLFNYPLLKKTILA